MLRQPLADAPPQRENFEFHIICVCTRYAQAIIVPDREVATILIALASGMAASAQDAVLYRVDAQMLDGCFHRVAAR